MDFDELSKLVEKNITPEMKKAIENAQKATSNIDMSVFNNPTILQMQKELINSPSINKIKFITSSVQNPSPEIAKIQSLLNNDDALKAIQEVSSLLKGDTILAQNLALIKFVSQYKTYIELPKGLYRSLQKLHTDTAKKMLNDPDLKFDKANKNFYSEENSENKISVSEANLIYSSLDLFSGITAKDLMQFNNELVEYPEYASNHPIGKKIYSIIKDWNNFIDFDKEYYYHARSLEKEQIPYSIEEMKKAPHGITSQGRFNHNGRSHYYFSDTRNGAISEIRKHGKKHCRIQVAKLKAIKDIKLFDISSCTINNDFLNYCRYAPNYKNINNLPNEYLLPCFVASTCKKLKIDGIKYYGNKESNNYVTLKDSYFEIVDMDIIE